MGGHPKAVAVQQWGAEGAREVHWKCSILLASEVSHLTAHTLFVWLHWA